MTFLEAIQKAQDAVTVERVYGQPYERDGVVVIPAARISGAGGGGGGEDPDRGGSGSGGGFSVGARPVGAYVVEAGQVRWQPAVDVTRIAAYVAATTLAAIVLVGRRRR